MKKQHQVGDILFLTMQRPNQGNFPIARTDEGLICLIKSSQQRKFYEYDSTWMCSVEQVDEHKLIVEPISLEVHASENRFKSEKKAKEVFGKPKADRKKNAAYNYPYAASYQK